MKVLGMANVQTGQARWLLLASKFKDEYKKLCNPENPFIEGKFFGPDLDTATALLASQNKVQKTALEQPTKSNRGKWSKSGNCTWITAILLGSSSTLAVLSHTKPASFHSYWWCHPFFRVASLVELSTSPSLSHCFLSSTNSCTTETNQEVVD